MTIDGKGIGVSLELSNWSKYFSCSFPCFLKYLCNAMVPLSYNSATVMCFMSVYPLIMGVSKYLGIKFGGFNIGKLLKNLPVANINSSPINHLVQYNIFVYF